MNGNSYNQSPNHRWNSPNNYNQSPNHRWTSPNNYNRYSTPRSSNSGRSVRGNFNPRAGCYSPQQRYSQSPRTPYSNSNSSQGSFYTPVNSFNSSNNSMHYSETRSNNHVRHNNHRKQNSFHYRGNNGIQSNNFHSPRHSNTGKYFKESMFGDPWKELCELKDQEIKLKEQIKAQMQKNK